MRETTQYDRFQELEAGRVLGDLDAQELQEWKELADALGTGPDLSLELVAAAVETEFLGEGDEPLPAGVAMLLRTAMLPHVTSGAATARQDNIIRPAFWSRLLRAPQTGWGIAAILAILLVANLLIRRGTAPESGLTGSSAYPTTKPTQLVTAEARENLRRDAPDLLALPIAGLPGYDKVSGELIWSDSRQEGYMTLTNLAANDSTRNQYQLWIVDPSRDDEPVDGGVFNVFPGQEASLIPIRNPVAVSHPVAFLITLEKPGGVVVSDQAVKVALAKAS